MENQSELKMLRLILFVLLNNICSTIAFTQNKLDVAIFQNKTVSRNWKKQSTPVG